MKKPLVAVAMSGGIDSSVAAVLLKQQGYEVIGLTMKLWDFAEVGGGDKQTQRRCCSLEMFEDARSVCFRYDIPHYVLNMHEDFRDTVIADFVSEYVQGRTPNPCVVCNYKIKWELLEAKTKQLSCDYLATGHYARIRQEAATGRWQILKGVDPTRDQSYFLWGVKQESLARTLFPLGELHKTEVRELGRQFGLINAERAESREICFVPDNNYTRLVEKQRPELAQPGNVRDTQGNIVGKHDGYFRYTIGQAKRVQIASPEKKYVTKIIPETNEIVVGNNDDLLSDRFTVTEVNWVSLDPTVLIVSDSGTDLRRSGSEDAERPKNPTINTDSRGSGSDFATGERTARHPSPISAFIKIRYLHKPVAGEIRCLTEHSVDVRLTERQRAITPGQSCVFYDGDVVLGGGKIA